MSITELQHRSDGADPAPSPRPPWEQLGPAPHSPVRAALAERLFRHAVRDLPVCVALAGGQRLGRGGTGAPLMRIERPRDFFHRLGAHGKIGFGEAYMAGDWSSPEPAEVLTPFAARLSELVPRPLQTLRHRVDARQPEAERNTTSGARSNIHRHYDLSNDFFANFLDPTMTYSGAALAPGGDLEEAQLAKLDSVLDLAGVRSGTRLLEIGTGWGSLAICAARRGASVTTLTLSEQQRRLATDRVTTAGLSDLVDVRLRDYRQEHGRYDAVVSVEMIEAVGAEYWPTYFGVLDRLLVDGGRASIQAITMPHDRLLATRDSYTWIHKYVFPGGLLPSVEVIERNIGANTGMTPAERYAFGPGYAETLRRWRQRFTERWPDIAALGFDEALYRMWEFYLAYSEAGFRSGYLDVWQFGLRKAGGR
ncbi:MULTISPECIES: cyclopropane-fatty-acyl-phospholipid synthase family protein [unclassified Actinopolyspora]|uniref:SAM-dependent methyltransferase n=1 Tax=unclassified Actinopolyspora TaxID=2639451 RepID=UPI0013F64C92|nr:MULTISPECIES: cyclopropane-fatty-acyl-phospholipid synthase family protein [unclassified Actinopolyspora]NHD16177.1 class I SAM-dependent methyltransferase [Actinopolyspora sp. BKK2]NHE74609.1 class I SAM-dependent methyltransferase [Actinopolyspora sp. BKK1]